MEESSETRRKTEENSKTRRQTEESHEARRKTEESKEVRRKMEETRVSRRQREESREERSQTEETREARRKTEESREVRRQREERRETSKQTGRAGESEEQRDIGRPDPKNPPRPWRDVAFPDTCPIVGTGITVLEKGQGRWGGTKKEHPHSIFMQGGGTGPTLRAKITLGPFANWCGV
ncbi:hypothetical protein NDU88_009996 [Pleurodeles waltl]|uniref:Uncharacterized protein n=1 Tax=Pleurodeles waltl TaxID=8319 RepID=A0AAV7RWT7_PLEWA|nr:hypothetical protein NDU88_009996 [Pleurodeles waltl]